MLVYVGKINIIFIYVYFTVNDDKSIGDNMD